jgi:hypothetical protein
MRGMRTDEQAAARREIIHKHCAMQTGRMAGTPRFCNPTRAEQIRAGRRGHPAQRRAPIIFPSVQHAQRCADELAALDGIQMNVYECPRSRSGHAHLSGH